MRAMTHLVYMGSSIDSRGFRVACVGAGVMGHSWATLFAVKGCQVALQDVSEDNLERAMGWMRTALELMAEKEVIPESEVETALSRVHPTTDLGEAVGEAGFVLESVYEDYGAKRDIFREMDAHAPEEAILATGSSRLLITEIQKATERPERCVGAHGFNPPTSCPWWRLSPGRLPPPRRWRRPAPSWRGSGRPPSW